ncbi:MAG: GDP-mannose 4,6-dehydratase [Acidobacteriota bacterium]
MRVLITGITGFVGRRFARHLLAHHEHEIVGLATDLETWDLEEIEVECVDVTDREALGEVIARRDPEAIVHFAGLSHVGESWQRPGDYLRVNFGGTRNLVHAAAGRRVLFASSAEVYGKVPADEQPIREGRPVDPRSPYAMTKACAEEIALDRGAVIVRSFNAIGPGQSLQFALPSFAHQLAAIQRGEHEPVIHVGDLSPERDFLHIEDAVRGYATLLESAEAGTVYNLASGQSHSIADVLDRLRAISGVDAEVRRDEARVRVVDMPLMCGDVSRLRGLGWSPRFTAEDALADLWRAAISDPVDATAG